MSMKWNIYIYINLTYNFPTAAYAKEWAVLHVTFCGNFFFASSFTDLNIQNNLNT